MGLVWYRPRSGGPLNNFARRFGARSMCYVLGVGEGKLSLDDGKGGMISVN